MGADDDRRGPDDRHSTTHPAWIIKGDGSRMEVTVTSLSGAGVGLRGSGMSVGEQVDLLVPGQGCFTIQIRWTAGDKVGARFAD